MSSKSMSQNFKILFETGDVNNFNNNVNNFALCGVFFSRYLQPKAPFLRIKSSAVKSET